MKNAFISIIALGFIAGCSGGGSLGGSTGSLGGSSGNSSGGSSANSSGGSSGGSFGGRRVEEAQLDTVEARVETRGFIPVVSVVKVDNYRGGVLIHAIGKVDKLGYSKIDLVAVNSGVPDENGVVSYEFRAEAPLDVNAPKTERAQEVYAGASINSKRLPAIRSIRVIAGQNQVTVSK